MSRSFKKSPVFAHTGARSEKDDKRAAHQRTRAHFRTQLASAADMEAFAFTERAVAHSQRNDHAKDGKAWSAAMRVQRVWRSLRTLATPRWVAGAREARVLMGK